MRFQGEPGKPERTARFNSFSFVHTHSHSPEKRFDFVGLEVGLRVGSSERNMFSNLLASTSLANLPDFFGGDFLTKSKSSFLSCIRLRLAKDKGLINNALLPVAQKNIK